MSKLSVSLCISILLIPFILLSCQKAIPEDLVLVEAGSFQMGSPEGEVGRSGDETRHLVEITRDFYISKYEVTQSEWVELMGSNPSGMAFEAMEIGSFGDDRPVNGMNWKLAVQFCNALSEKERLEPAYIISGSDIQCNFDAEGYRLPTEAEWEYAARGGHLERETLYAGADDAESVAWYKDNAKAVGLDHGDFGLHNVGEKAPNELGLYDMSGNIAEWCWDLYGRSYYEDSPLVDPQGADRGVNRVVRGSSWQYDESSLRVAKRSYMASHLGELLIGLRVVRTK